MAANPEQPNSSDRTSLRDAGLRRVRSASRWLAGGAVILTGAFAGIAASSTKQSSSTTTQTSTPAQATQSDDSGATLQAPAQTPQQAPSSSTPQSSSGAS